ncbi:transposable element Tcb2 transposase [Trichonephila clavipes]|nr:transposable element Tcb2 transposase [Trichonephila clavipes]
MARRNHLDDFTRGRMIGKLEEGRTVTSVAVEFGINKSVVSRAWKAFQTTCTAVRKELMESEDITQIDWPAYSPDLNPIEHVWDALGRRFAARLHHPENTQQLKTNPD